MDTQVASTLATTASGQAQSGVVERIATWVQESHEGNPTDFRHVHREWLTQCKPIPEMLIASQPAEQECTDVDVDARALIFTGNRVETAGLSLDFTDHGLGMLSTWFGVPRAAARQLAADDGDPQIFQDYFRWRQRVAPPKTPLKLRLRGTTIRAVFTQKYREITNAWLIEAFNRLVPTGLVSHFRGDGDTISGNILIPDTIRSESDSDYGGGIGFRHSEIGIFRIQILPFVFRAICCNGCIWGALEGVALRKAHLGEDVNEDDLFERIKETIHRQIPLVPELIARMQRLKDVRFASRIEVIRIIYHLSDSPRIAREQAKAWLRGFREEGAELNAFGIVQGLTRAARNDSTTEASGLEEFAGELVDRIPSWWSAIRDASRDVTGDALVKRFGEEACL